MEPEAEVRGDDGGVGEFILGESGPSSFGDVREEMRSPLKRGASLLDFLGLAGQGSGEATS